LVVDWQLVGKLAKGGNGCRDLRGVISTLLLLKRAILARSVIPADSFPPYGRHYSFYFFIIRFGLYP
jgi:hypothetical protein